MNEAVLGLTAGFMLLAGLLLILMLKTRLATAYKISALVALTLFYWVQYQSLQRYAGWPVVQPLPDEFVLIASEVIEPDRQRGEPGRMYWWVRESGDGDYPPRVYEIPYKNEIHQQAAEVLDEQEQGAQFVGRQSGNPHADDNFGIRFEKISKAERYRKK